MASLGLTGTVDATGAPCASRDRNEDECSSRIFNRALSADFKTFPSTEATIAAPSTSSTRSANGVATNAPTPSAKSGGSEGRKSLRFTGWSLAGAGVSVLFLV